MIEQPHIKQGRLDSEKLTEADVKSILLDEISYYFDWQTSNTLDGWLKNISNSGGTFGTFYGWWDTNAKTASHIVVKLRDGRVFKFKKSDLYHNRTVQGVLL